MQELNLTMTLHLRAPVQQVIRAQIVLRLGRYFHMSKDWSVVRAKVVIQTSVVLDCYRTKRVVLNHNPVCVRGTLIFLVNVVIARLFTLIGRHKLNLFLFISREHLPSLLGNM